MRFEARSIGKAIISDDQRVVLDHVHLKGEHYVNRKLVQFCTIGSRLEQCRFDNMRIKDTQFGSGRAMSEFIDCSFDGSRMDGGGGITRFVHCSFRNVDLRHWLCLTAEFIDCVFTGHLRKCIFNGTVCEQDRQWIGRYRNEFSGNDFSAADLVEVDFRTGIDLTKQRLPSGTEYLYLPDPTPVIERARAEVLGWLDFEHRRSALIMLKTMEEQIADGQPQLFLRASDHYAYSAIPRDAVDNLFAFLHNCTGRNDSGTS
jgi:hypothetical protein